MKTAPAQVRDSLFTAGVAMGICQTVGIVTEKISHVALNRFILNGTTDFKQKAIVNQTKLLLQPYFISKEYNQPARRARLGSGNGEVVIGKVGSKGARLDTFYKQLGYAMYLYAKKQDFNVRDEEISAQVKNDMTMEEKLKRRLNSMEFQIRRFTKIKEVTEQKLASTSLAVTELTDNTV